MIFFNHKVSESDDRCINFTAEDGSDIIGCCKLILKDSYADVVDVAFTDGNQYIVDGLIKAALNFACNRSYYIARCSAADIDYVLDRMNFIKKDGYYENDIPSVLSGSCGGCCK